MYLLQHPPWIGEDAGVAMRRLRKIGARNGKRITVGDTAANNGKRITTKAAVADGRIGKIMGGKIMGGKMMGGKLGGKIMGGKVGQATKKLQHTVLPKMLSKKLSNLLQVVLVMVRMIRSRGREQGSSFLAKRLLLGWLWLRLLLAASCVWKDLWLHGPTTNAPQSRM